MKLTLDQVTAPIPETRMVFVALGFDLRWEYNGPQYILHWDLLSNHQQNRIDEAYVTDTMALEESGRILGKHVGDGK